MSEAGRDTSGAPDRGLLDSMRDGRAAAERPFGRRVVHCIGSLGPGGAERQLCNVAVASAGRGWDVKVLTTSDLTGTNAHYLPLLQQRGIVARRAGSALQASSRETLLQANPHLSQVSQLPSFLLPYAQDFAVEMLVDPPDVVHAWLDLTNKWAGVAALITGVPVVILSLRNMSPPRFPYIHQDWFKPWYSLLATSSRVHFINNSSAGAQDYAAWIGLPSERIRVITNGVDPESIRVPELAPETLTATRDEIVPARARLLLGVFRLSAEKRPMMFFEVARRALADFDDLRVAVVGSGPMREELEAAIAEHGLEARFRLLGHRRDVHSIIAASDLLLMTSLYEGTPNVVLEAQMLGRPVVGTRSGGTTEAIDDHRTGRLLDIHDVNGLTSAVHELLSDDRLRARMGAAGPAFVTTKFGLHRMVDETLGYYEQHLGGLASGLPNTRRPSIPSRFKTKLLAVAKNAYITIQRYPAAASVAEKFRQFSWLHGDFSVPNAFRSAIRSPANDPIAHVGVPRRVTHYIGSLGAGGSERQLCNLAVASAARGIAQRVLTAADLTGPNGHYVPQLRTAGIVASRAGAETHSLIHQLVAELPRLKLLEPCPPFLRPYMESILVEIMADPPDVLHCWLDLTNIWAGVAGLIADVPAIVLSTRSVNPSNFPGINNPWFKIWYQALAESPRVHFINNSSVGARDYAQWLDLPEPRFEVIRNGVDLGALERPTPEDRRSVRRELGLGADVPVLIGVLRLTEEKQPMLFLEAGLEVIRRVPDAHVLLVGSGPYERVLAEAIATNGVEHRFQMLGPRSDVYRLMAASDLLLLTSRLEGTPNVLLEAQWMGCPVATTPAGGAVDALSDGVTGIILDGGQRSVMLDQVVALMEDRQTLQAMGDAGPAYIAENFSVARMVDETLALYQRALHPGQDGRRAEPRHRLQRG